MEMKRTSFTLDAYPLSRLRFQMGLDAQVLQVPVERDESRRDLAKLARRVVPGHDVDGAPAGA